MGGSAEAYPKIKTSPLQLDAYVEIDDQITHVNITSRASDTTQTLERRSNDEVLCVGVMESQHMSIPVVAFKSPSGNHRAIILHHHKHQVKLCGGWVNGILSDSELSQLHR